MASVAKQTHIAARLGESEVDHMVQKNIICVHIKLYTSNTIILYYFELKYNLASYYNFKYEMLSALLTPI